MQTKKNTTKKAVKATAATTILAAMASDQVKKESRKAMKAAAETVIASLKAERIHPVADYATGLRAASLVEELAKVGVMAETSAPKWRNKELPPPRIAVLVAEKDLTFSLAFAKSFNNPQAAPVPAAEPVADTLAADLEAGKVLAEASIDWVDRDFESHSESTIVAPVEQPVAPAEETTEVKAKTKKAAKAAKKAAPAKASKAGQADDAIRIRLYGKGEFYFQRVAAARLKGFANIAVKVEGKVVTLTPQKSSKDALVIMFSHGAPVLRVAKLLAETGWSKQTQDLVAQPVGEFGMTVEVK